MWQPMPQPKAEKCMLLRLRTPRRTDQQFPGPWYSVMPLPLRMNLVGTRQGIGAPLRGFVVSHHGEKKSEHSDGGPWVPGPVPSPEWLQAQSALSRKFRSASQKMFLLAQALFVSDCLLSAVSSVQRSRVGA